MRSIFVAAAMALAGTAQAAQPGELLAIYETAACARKAHTLRREDPDTFFFMRRHALEGDTAHGLEIRNALVGLYCR